MNINKRIWFHTTLHCFLSRGSSAGQTPRGVRESDGGHVHVSTGYTFFLQCLNRNRRFFLIDHRISDSTATKSLINLCLASAGAAALSRVCEVVIFCLHSASLSLSLSLKSLFKMTVWVCVWHQSIAAEFIFQFIQLEWCKKICSWIKEMTGPCVLSQYISFKNEIKLS